MLLYIIRHGDPIYNPDSLTELGKIQARAVAKRLAKNGIDKIYSSPLIRAQQTAEPTSILLKKEVNIEEWTSENVATKYFWDRREGKYGWVMNTCKEYLHSSVKKYGFNWYDDPCYEGIPVKEGYEAFLNNSDEFLARHGYKHDRENCCYIAENPNDERIAVFCHQGFGVSWLGTLLDIPLPLVWANFDITHTGVTVVRFEGKRCIPKVLTLSNDSHLYKEDLPTKHNNIIYI